MGKRRKMSNASLLIGRGVLELTAAGWRLPRGSLSSAVGAKCQLTTRNTLSQGSPHMSRLQLRSHLKMIEADGVGRRQPRPVLFPLPLPGIPPPCDPVVFPQRLKRRGLSLRVCVFFVSSSNGREMTEEKEEEEGGKGSKIYSDLIVCLLSALL